jgi:hypothetical protein
VQPVRMGELSNVSLTANERQEIERGQAAVNRRRAEFAFCANGSRKTDHKPQPPQIKQPAKAETVQAETIPSQYPEQVSFYTFMGLQAARRFAGSGGAWRLYTLAKALDGHGREAAGEIEADKLRAYALDLGAHPHTYRNWYKSAVKIGLLDPVQKKSGAWRLILPSAGKAAYYMGTDDIGRKANMSAADLIGNGWKSRVNTVLAARGLQISRERNQKVFNVAASTQRYRDNQAGVNRQANYAQSDYKADSLPMLKEFGQYKGLFVASNKRVYWRLPDTRTTDIVKDAGKGRGRKAKAELRNLQDQEHNSAFKMQRANGDDPGVDSSEFVRLFCNTQAQRKASEKKVSRQDNFTVTEIYQAAYENKESGAGIWDVFGQM